MENLIKEHFDLTPYNTFGIKCSCRYFAEYSSADQLTKIFRTPEFKNSQLFHIGGGSNLLIFDEFEGFVLHSAIRGIVEYHKNEEEHYVIAGAGEKWSELVEWTVLNGYTGMECMADIPGEVGASAIQNVGAFGAEAKDVIFNVECFDTETGEIKTFTNEECRFSYRDSRFKRDWKNRYFVLRVSFKLRKSENAENLSYNSLKEFADSLDHTATTREVMNEVKRLRAEKLPPLSEYGSAGSFFKNPVVHKNYYADEVLRRNSEVPSYKVDYRLVKIPAGWLIDKAGLAGERVGDAEVYPENCLVIVNRGNATAQDVRTLASKIIAKVREKFGITLSPEVNYIDSEIKVTVLGSGTSKGVPEIGCDCWVCRSSDPKDKRLRSSVLIETMGQRILIDVSPDFREQALKNDIRYLDAALLTHIHFDHIGGLEDLRPFCLSGDIPLYCRADVDADLRERLAYCFKSEVYPGVPTFDTHIIGDRPFMANGVRVIPITVEHGKFPIAGFRIGDFAYVTDCKHISETEKEKLEGLDVLILNALRDREHFAHLTIKEALELIDELKPKRAYLTHFCHEAGTHRELEESLPENVRPLYDNMEIIIGKR